MASIIIYELLPLQNPEKSRVLAGFFKTGKWEYGEGDKFLGITVPIVRSIVEKYAKQTSLEDAIELLQNEWHEIRLAGVLLLVWFFEKNIFPKERVFSVYLSCSKKCNNWDLVDVSAPKIIWEYLRLYKTEEEILLLLSHLAQSSNLWERRIAIVSTFAFLKQGNATITQKIACMLLNDPELLIHKATGWMLREMGKQCSRDVLINFINTYIYQMPRTMLRYSMEHLPKDMYKKYLEMEK